MFEKAFLEEMSSALAGLGHDFAEAYMESSKGYAVSREKGEDRENRLSDSGIGVRVKSGGKWLFSWKKTADPGEMLAFARGFRENRSPGSGPEETVPGEDAGEAGSSRGRKLLDEVIASIGGQNAAGLDMVLRSSREDVAVVNTEGVLKSENRSRKMFYAHSAVEGGKGADAVMLSGKAGNERLFESFRRCAEEAVRLAGLRKASRKAPVGEMPVVFSGRAAGFLLHETAGHLFEADNHGRSEITGLLGSEIGPPELTLVENGPEPSLATFDDEGVEPLGKVLVERGRIASFLSDRRSSAGSGLGSSGNARRAGYRHEPLVRMWSFGMLPSGSSENELLEGMDFGLFVKRLEDGRMDMRTGEFSFPVVEGYLVRSGKLAEPVSGTEILGRTPHFLKDITLIGDTTITGSGLCLKKKQVIWISETAPAFRTTRMSVRSYS